jgi:hypothetical protein
MRHCRQVAEHGHETPPRTYLQGDDRRRAAAINPYTRRSSPEGTGSGRRTSTSSSALRGSLHLHRASLRGSLHALPDPHKVAPDLAQSSPPPPDLTIAAAGVQVAATKLRRRQREERKKHHCRLPRSHAGFPATCSSGSKARASRRDAGSAGWVPPVSP